MKQIRNPKKGVFPSDLINRCVEKWFAEQEKFDEEGQEYYKHRGNNYTQMMWKASKKCKSKTWTPSEWVDSSFLDLKSLFAKIDLANIMIELGYINKIFLIVLLLHS